MTIRPLRRRLVAAYMALILVVLTVAGLFLLNHLSALFIEAITRDLTIRAIAVRDLGVAPVWPLVGNQEGDAVAARLAAVTEGRVTVIGPDGTVLAESSQPSANLDNHADRPEFQAALAGGTGVAQRYSESTRERMMYLAVPLRVAAGATGVDAVVRLSISLEWVWAKLDAIRTGLLIALGGSLALAAAVGLSVGGRLITGPLSTVVAGARSLLAGQLDTRIELTTGDEWQLLASSLNQMAASLAGQLHNLREERNRVRDSLERLPDGVLLISSRGSLLLANRRARQWLRLAEVLGQYGPEPQAAAPRPTPPGGEPANLTRRAVDLLARSLELRGFVQAALDGQPRAKQEIQLRGPTSAQLEVSAHWVGAPQEGDLVVVLHDISEIRHLEIARRDLVANVSHELKTPIGAIRVLAESLADGADDDPALLAEFLGRIVRETERLAGLVDEMLYLSRLESEVDPISLESVTLEDLLANAVSALAPLAEAKSITVNQIGGQDTRLRCDPGKIESAIKALLDNAIKFSPAGSTISARTAPLAEEVELLITDRGPGIPEEVVGRIFERFYKADESRGSPGSGIGLAIVKHVVLAHGGRVLVESRVGQGSTFGFVLPRRQA